MEAEIFLLTTPIDPAELRRLTASSFGDMAKHVVDVERGRIEYTSLINIRPRVGNRSMELSGENDLADPLDSESDLRLLRVLLQLDPESAPQADLVAALPLATEA